MERREEQERNVQAKRTKGEEDTEEGDDLESSMEDGDEGAWDDEEDISEGEGSKREESDHDESEPDPGQRPAKKTKTRSQR